MPQVQFQVYANQTCLQNNRRLFERIVSVNDSCSIPFDTIIRALTFLFGQGVIININIQAKWLVKTIP